MNSSLSSVTVVIPALNEGKRILGVIKELVDLGFKKIIVVDDGSSDNTKEILKPIEEVVLIDHIINLGAGASTRTGIDYALKSGAEIIAMIDADHQHHPKDLIPLLDELNSKNLDMVIGSRFLQKNEIPKIRLLYNFVGNLISFAKTGIYLTDSQSGMKVINKRFADELSIDYNGFEYCIEIIRQANLKKFKIGEKAINVTYTPETMSKGQSFQNGLLMLGRLLNPF